MAFARTAISTTGNTTAGSNQLTNVANTTGIYAGMLIYGTNIPADTLVNSVSGTTVVMNRNAVGTQTGVALTGQYITQTGTDADPSGLSAMTGVTTITSGTGSRLKSIYDLGTNQLRIQGTLTHDPDQHTIVSGLQLAVRFESGTYNYGLATTINGKTSYSKSCGLELTYQGGIASNFPIQQTGGTFNWRGGIVRFGGAWSITNGTFNQQGDTSVAFNNNTGTQIQLRTILPPSNMSYDKIKLAGVNQTFFWTTQSYGAISAALENGAIQTASSYIATVQSYDNFSFGSNQAPADFYLNQLTNPQSTLSVIKNPDVIPRVAQLNTGAYGVVETRTALAFNVSDSNGVSAANVVGYVKDSNNGARTNENQLTYTTDRTYIASSSVAGFLSLGDILVNVQMRNPAATTTVKHDYRSNYGNGSADFNVFLGGYEYLSTVTRQTLLGNGGRNVAWTMFEDSNVTLTRAAALTKLSSSFTVNPSTKTVTVTANSTYDDLHDALKAYKYNGTQANFETPTPNTLIVTPNGSNLVAATGWTLVVNSGVTLSEGAKFTFVSFNTVTVNGNIDGIYASSAGVNTKLDVLNIKDGAAYIVANNTTKATIQYGINTTGEAQTYSLFFPPGSAGQQVYVARQAYGDQFDFAVVTLTEGGMFVGFNDIPDEGITQTNKATVDAYTTLETTSKLYDYINSYRMTEEGIKKGAIVTRAGPILQFGNFSGVIKQNASSVFDITGSTITIKASAFSRTTRYTTLVATPPATWEADTNEVIDLDIEDANGDSSVTIQAGNVSTFEIWKLADGVDEDDYATGTLLDTVGPGKFRFIGEDGFKLVIRDQLTNYRVSVEMEKGVYIAELFFGAQVQLAQSATVELIYTLAQSLEVDLDAIKGTGFVKDKDSLINIRKKAALAAALSA